MSRLRKIILILLSLISITVAGQEVISFSGLVLDDETNMPVPLQPVFVTAGDSLFLNTYYTDADGFFMDSIQTGGMVIPYLQFYTFDCLGLIQDTTVFDLDQAIYVEFHICTDSLPGDCQADFVTFPQGPVQYTIAFMDVSFGGPDSWFWDFGDSTFSTEQNPIHTYDGPGSYEVCLTISTLNGACFSTACYPVIVFDEGCIADFEHLSNPINSLEISFQNLSSGNFTEISWDFGDGSFSSEENPVHLYQYPGEYEVCLAISNADSLSPCFDMSCQVITVGMGMSCSANFTYQLDSLSQEPYAYQFFDQSTGNIDSWYWDFGDGNISFDQNPFHQYADTGLYEVCLTISNLSFPEECFDTYCQQILTPGYFNFGGLVWAGEYPLNNPTFAYDTGIVMLYRLHQEQLHFVKSKSFYENGYYWFSNVLEGDYLLKVSLSDGSTNYQNYLPTYFGDAVEWSSATLIHLQQEQFNKHIYMVPTIEMESGPGTISGYLTYEGNVPAGAEHQTNIILMDEFFQPLGFTEPSLSGSFEFNDLPLGTYHVKADLAGRPSEVQLVTLTSSSPIASLVEVIVNESSFFEVRENLPLSYSIGLPYPNPVRNKLNIGLSAVEKFEGKATITDMAGKCLLEKQLGFPGGNQNIQLDVSSLSKGIYLLKISTLNGPASTVKFVK